MKLRNAAVHSSIVLPPIEMYTIASHFDALPALYEQHRLYTDELAKTHASLSKLYKKLTKAERRLHDQGETKLSRAQSKKLWWSRSVAKQSIEKIEAQKASLYNLLQQCRDLITSYNHGLYYTPATSFWTAHFPPTPFAVTPFTPFPETPWTAGPYRTPFAQQTGSPQYWDLSMLGEHQERCPVDSGYIDADAQSSDHVFVHEMMTASCCSAAGAASVSSTASEKDELPAMLKLTKIDTNFANTLHRRRYSEHATRLHEERPRMARRGASAAPRTRNGYTTTASEVAELSGYVPKGKIE